MLDISGHIVIIDFGGQYAHLIASRIRRFGYRSCILPTETKASELKGAAGIIFSGGPQSVYEKGSPQADPEILKLGIPVLGLCYGHHWLGQTLGGKTTPAKVKEYGPVDVKVLDRANPLFAGLPTGFRVWMSHGDEVSVLPDGFVAVASTKDCRFASMADLRRQIFGIQFHIEVTHSQHGMDILRRFVDLCRPSPWSVKSYRQEIEEQVQRQSKGKKVFMLVSGGVDSTVAFTLLTKVLGADRVQGLLIDTGLMRKGEIALIQKAFSALGIKNLAVKDASEQFFRNLEGSVDPEDKRRIIGETFIQVQKQAFDAMGFGERSAISDQRSESQWLLGQGTIYPDTIETGGTKHSDKIKTHHNRVELVQRMIEEGLVIEPLKDLYKDEVRELGEELGLPHDLVWRHPFPGPGLGVRILCAEKPSLPEGFQVSSFKFQVPYAVLPVRSVGVQGDGRTYRHALVLFSKKPCEPTQEHFDLAASIPNENRTFSRVLLCSSHSKPFTPVFTPTFPTKEMADLLREADAIVDEEVRKADLYKAIWQFPVVLLPTGAKEGNRSIVLRPIESTDAMTASAFRLPPKVLQGMTERILKIRGIDAVFLDLTSKPPGTIEWE
ncbi:MAG: glutamine-hydrolyzing GMP synthase [Candidatus Peribacteraceae bacterium]|nr:glutamine-hydrolyzing GMP synthase [Candidatus Peribacteraceae bacterium]